MKGKHKKFGKPQQMSRFICLKCLQENHVGEGIQRERIRERSHIKNLACLCSRLERTKNLEVRYFDDFGECMEEAKLLHTALYGKEGVKNGKGIYA